MRQNFSQSSKEVEEVEEVVIDLSEVVASSFSKFGHTNRTIFSTAEAISTNEVFKYQLSESPRFCIYFSAFSTFIVLKSSLIMWSAILSYNRSWRLNWISQNFPLALHKKFPCNAIWNEILCGNAGSLTFYSDSWALISYQTWFHLTINALNALKIHLST